MNTLCTVLPDAPPSTHAAERVVFISPLRTDWCHDYDAPDMHSDFLAEGLPYTVQLIPGMEDHILKDILAEAEHDDFHEESAIEFLEDRCIYHYSHNRCYLIELAWRNGWRPET